MMEVKMSPKVSLDYITDFNFDFELEPSATALVIVDMQYASACRETGLGKSLQAQGKEELVRYRYDRIEQVVVPTIRRLLAFFRRHRLAVVYLTMGSEMPDFSDALPHLKAFFTSSNNRLGTTEHEILEDVKPEPGELVLNKTTMGAYSSTNLDSIMWSRGIKFLLFTGVSTNMCVDTTARDGADRGFRCVIVEDACGASTQSYHDAALITFQRLFGKVQSAQDVIGELESEIRRQA
jgi:nicotinamidase-related amidase